MIDRRRSEKRVDGGSEIILVGAPSEVNVIAAKHHVGIRPGKDDSTGFDCHSVFRHGRGQGRVSGEQACCLKFRARADVLAHEDCRRKILWKGRQQAFQGGEAASRAADDEDINPILNVLLLSALLHDLVRGHRAARGDGAEGPGRRHSVIFSRLPVRTPTPRH